MLNNLLIKAADFTGFVLNRIGYYRPIRSKSDLRLVFYHGIGDGSLPCFRYLNDETPMEIFVEQINYLQKNYKMLPLEEAILTTLDDRKYRNEGPFCNISFDDGLSTVYTKAFPLLKERGLNATVFVNTSVIGNHSLLWLHFLNFLISNYGSTYIAEKIGVLSPDKTVKPPSSEKALLEWCSNHFKFIYELNILNKIAQLLKIDIKEIAEMQRLYLDWDQINVMTESGFTFYSHTENHTPLSTLSYIYLKREIDEARKCMIRYNQSFGRFISFPFGMEKDYGRKAKEYALSAGHEFIFEVGNGSNPPSRVKKERVFSRVGLGDRDSNPTKLYATIELRPLLKSIIKRCKKFYY